MKENASSTCSQRLRRLGIAIIAIAIATAPALPAKAKSKKSTATPANVVAHLELSGGSATRMLLVKKSSKKYLLLGLDSSPQVAILDVSEPSQPRTVATAARAAGASAVELKIVADTLAFFGTSDAESAVSSGPKELRSLSGVTAFVQDKAHGLIYATNADGLWIVKTRRVADDDAQYYGSLG